ncbi:MAG: hypothetical protein KJO31_10395 [Gammaproteobacteria bacterium]|nr:hypothetical protein [Gammaproteobacteria bacterium]
MHTKNSVNPLVAFVALFVVSLPSHAEFSPATFGDPTAEKSIFKFIDFPEVTGDVTAAMLCAVISVHNGKLKDNLCFLQNDFDQPFAGALFNAAKKARLVPAMIDGRAQTVYFQYRVQFKQKGEEQEVTFLPNPGVKENVEEYGPEHFGAQRLIGKEKWQGACPQRKEWAVLAKAHVNEQGKASNVSLSHSGGIIPPVACQDAIIKNLIDSRYIPAFADGIPVPSTFAEPFSN